MWFLAHLTLSPLEADEDGKREQFTVEHEFEATSWPTAWEHCMATAAKFRARLAAHKMVEVKKDTGELVAPALPPPQPKPEPTWQEELRAKLVEPEPGWYEGVAIKWTAPAPWPDDLCVSG
jgi:hypothetical protein